MLLVRAMKDFLRGVLGVVIAIPFAGLLAMMFLGPPLAAIWETVDILRMHETAPGQITAVTYETGGKGTSRARIEYAYSIGGQQLVSDRYLPGFFGNHGTWTGGAAVGLQFPVGRPVTIHYSAGEPTLCALEYGWFCWSVAPTLVYVGLAIIAFACVRLRPRRLADGLWCGGVACVVYGAGELFLGPSAVRVRDLHWHVLAWCGALAGAALYAWCKKRFPVPAVTSNGPPPDVADCDQSTPYLVFELLYVTVLLTVIVLSSWRVFPFATLATRALADGIADVAQLIATIVLFVGLAVVITIHVALLCAVYECSRKVLRRIAWHRSNPKSAV